MGRGIPHCKCEQPKLLYHMCSDLVLHSIPYTQSAEEKFDSLCPPMVLWSDGSGATTANATHDDAISVGTWSPVRRSYSCSCK